VGVDGGGGVNLLFTAVGLFGEFYGYERLAFGDSTGASAVEFAAHQLGAGLISNSLHVTGVNNSNQVIQVLAAHNFSAAHWTFTNWETGDRVSIIGTLANDVLIGSRG